MQLLSLGLTLASTLKSHLVRSSSVLLINLATVSMIVVGSLIEVTVLWLLPDTAIDLILSFGLAALFFSGDSGTAG